MLRIIGISCGIVKASSGAVEDNCNCWSWLSLKVEMLKIIVTLSGTVETAGVVKIFDAVKNVGGW